MESDSDSEPDHTLESEAEQVVRLLNEVEQDHRSPAWEELLDCLCHQGDLYPESLPSLPRLAAFATSWPLDECLEPLFLASTIVTSANDSSDKDGMHRQYASEFAGLISRVHECLCAPAVYEKENGFIHLLGALLAFEGTSPWDRIIDSLVNGEYTVECPSCGNSVDFTLDERLGYSVTAENNLMHSGVPCAPLLPTTPSRLNSMAHRLYTAAKDQNQESLATQLLHLFGSATCPECAALFPTEGPLEGA